MKYFNISLAGVLIAALCVAVLYGNDRVDKRQAKQKNRIINGVKNGSLTKKETRKLGHEQRQINKMERRMRSDGKLDPKERIRLERRQDKASRHIYKEKHDGQSRIDKASRRPLRDGGQPSRDNDPGQSRDNNPTESRK